MSKTKDPFSFLNKKREPFDFIGDGKPQLDNKPTGPLKAAKEVGKSVLRGFENSAAGIGATTQWIGDTIQDLPKRKSIVVGGASVPVVVPEWEKNIIENIGKKVSSLGKDTQEFWQRESMRGIEAPDPEIFKGKFMENPSWTRGTALIAQAIPSLATATAITFATKSPMAGAASLGLLEGSGQYIEARKAGKDFKGASVAGGLSAIGNTILEQVPLTRFLKGGSGKLSKDILIGGLQEGAEEALQALWSNVIAKVGYDKTRNLAEGMLEGFIAGAGSGGVLGGFTSGRGTDIDNQINDAVSEGVTPEEINVMQETVKNQVINNADKIENVLNESSKEIEKTISDGSAEKKTLIQEARKYKTAEEFVESQEKEIVRSESVIPEEGKPFKFEYIRNLEKAPDAGKRFGQDIEPAGKYMTIGKAENVKDLPNFESGVVQFDNPLVIDFGGGYGEATNWKNVLSERYGGKTGKSLTRAIKADGYDGIVTVSQSGKTKYTSEILDLDVIDPSRKKLKTKQQLTDIWNKAQEQKQKTTKPKAFDIEIETGKLTPTGLNEQFNRARAATKTKAEVKIVQEQLIKALDESGLPPNTKAQFIKTIKNIQTVDQFNKEFPKIQDKIVRLVSAENKRNISDQIQKNLKFSKPLKQSATRKGKYDYETNKVFEDLRGTNKLNQENAARVLEDMGDPTTEDEAIKKRFLSLKANGMKASEEMHRVVLEDLKRLREVGENTKTLEDFERAVNRIDKIDAVLKGSGKVKENRSSIKNAVLNVYRKGFGDMYSVLNSVAGREIAETYNPELKENARDTATFFKIKEISKRSSDILGIKEKDLPTELYKMESEKFEVVDFEGLKSEISKMAVIDIYNSIKNEHTRKAYYDTFGQEQIDRLVSPSQLTDKERAFADYLQEEVQDYYPVLNEKNIREKGVDLGVVENYWMRSSEAPLNIIDDIRVQGETLSAQKERARGRVIPVPKNAWFKMQKHIAQGEHARHVSESYVELKKVFSNRKVKNNIVNKYGEDIYNLIQDQIDNMSLNKQAEKIDAVSGLIGKALNNWVTAKVALSPSVFVKQLISVGNYMENINSAEWTKHFMEGLSNPKKTLDYMWKIAPFLGARYGRGYSEAINRAMDEARKAGKLKDNWAKALTSLVRSGDIGAIVYGGYPVVKSELAKGKSIDEAVRSFEKATLRAQQSGLASSRSQFQNSNNPLARLFLAFKNTANQYLRKQSNAMISYANGDISSKQLAKVLTIYGLIQPALYGAASILMSGLLYRGFDDEDDMAMQMFTYLATAPVNAVPIINDLWSASVKKMTGQKVWKVFSTPLFDDIELAARKLTKKDIGFADVLESLSTLGEVTTGAPIKTYSKIYKRITGSDKKKKDPFDFVSGKSKKKDPFDFID